MVCAISRALLMNSYVSCPMVNSANMYLMWKPNVSEARLVLCEMLIFNMPDLQPRRGRVLAGRCRPSSRSGWWNSHRGSSRPRTRTSLASASAGSASSRCTTATPTPWPGACPAAVVELAHRAVPAARPGEEAAARPTAAASKSVYNGADSAAVLHSILRTLSCSLTAMELHTCRAEVLSRRTGAHPC